MAMLVVFQVCFFTGMGLLLLSLIFGSLFESLGIDGLDLDFDVFGVDVFLPVSPVLYILFATIFGGVGWVLMETKEILPLIIILLIAIGSGIGASVMVDLFVIRPLKRAQNTSTPEAEDLVGVRAYVLETIYENGFGEISYVINGNSYTSPARSTTGEEIKKGEDVAVCWVEEYVFYVTRIEETIRAYK